MADRLTIALPKGRLANETFRLLKEAGYDIKAADNDRKLVVDDPENPFRYLLVKPVDVITYVEEGVADLGVVGKDNILEEQKDIYAMLDLGIGQCKMVLAGPKHKTMPGGNRITVATKYPNITREALVERYPLLHIVPLSGSVELGPLVGLADVIVDIYETGSTLRANGLAVYEELVDLSAHLIANKASYRRNNAAILELRQRLDQRGE